MQCHKISVPNPRKVIGNSDRVEDLKCRDVKVQCRYGPYYVKQRPVTLCFSAKCSPGWWRGLWVDFHVSHMVSINLISQTIHTRLLLYQNPSWWGKSKFTAYKENSSECWQYVPRSDNLFFSLPQEKVILLPNPDRKIKQEKKDQTRRRATHAEPLEEGAGVGGGESTSL